MIVSLNELDSMTRKAFRGAGYYWGEAEEAGKAATWLARHGFPVVAPVLQLLDDAQARLPMMRPLSEGRTVRAVEGAMCPVLAGIAISDRAGEMKEGQDTRYGRLYSPLLIAPFLAAAAEAVPLRFLFRAMAARSMHADATAPCECLPGRPMSVSQCCRHWPPLLP